MNNIIFLLILISLLFSSCSNDTNKEENIYKVEDLKEKVHIINPRLKENPKDRLLEFLNLTLQNEHEKAYEFISERDREVRSKTQYLEYIYSPNNIFKTLFDNIKANNVSFTAEEGIVVDNKAVVTAILNISYQKDSSTIEGDKQNFTLFLENNNWYVFFDWATEQQVINHTIKIKTLLNDAFKLIKNNDNTNALKLYEQILQEEPDNKEALKATKDINDILFSQKEKKDYLENVVITDVIIKPIELSETEIPTRQEKAKITFKIKNNGFRVLKEVEVTISFYNVDRKILFSEKFYPILKGSYSEISNNHLEGHTIWGPKKDLFFVTTIPTGWDQKTFSAAITNIELEF